MQRKAGIALIFVLLFFSGGTICRADPTPMATSNMMGTIGLNLIPTARMDAAGTLRTTLSRTGPYTHSVLGLQINKRLFLALRQTADSPSLGSEANALYPGVDAKLRLFHEKKFRPEIAVGLQSALGRNRLAGQYLALSKRSGNLDVTGGFGWGRFGTRQKLINPVLFRNTSNTHWFQGPMGVFGGLEYTLTENLALKADWTSDDWKEETHKRASPWSFGASFKPLSWLDTGIAWNTGNGVMAHISIAPNLIKWPLRNASNPDDIILKQGRPTPPKAREKTIPQQLGLRNIAYDNATISADLDIQDAYPTPEDIGRATRYLSNIAGPKPENIALRLHHQGLRGADIILNRHDIEQALLHHQGSSEEIWHSSSLGYDLTAISSNKDSFLSFRSLQLDWQNDASLSENDSGLIGRSAILISSINRLNHHFITEDALRINLMNNLGGLNKYRTLNILPVREDIDVFTKNRLLIERSYIAGFATLAKDVHIAGNIGYLEEMYGGAGGEILYRPFAKPWAVGVEAALALKRDPYSLLGLGMNGDHILSGHLNVYYEEPESNVTVHGSIGRYLAGDVGGTVDIKNTLDNDIDITATTTITNRSDTDYINGGHTNVYAGLSLSIPFGSLSYIPNKSRMTMNAAPLGRNTGQRLKNPTPLYAATDSLSYQHITRHWSRLLP